jgi:hypothetical protein
MPFFDDDRQHTFTISNDEWHDRAYHTAARRIHENLLANADPIDGQEIQSLQTSIPTHKTLDLNALQEHFQHAIPLFPPLYNHYKLERAARWTTYRREQRALHELCLRVKGDPESKRVRMSTLLAPG